MDSNRLQEEYDYDYGEYHYEDGGYDKEAGYEGELVDLHEEDEPLTFDEPKRDDLRELRWDQMYSNKPADIDSRSIKDQQKTKRHWEERLSSGDGQHLFPDQTAPPLQVDVKTANDRDESIANLNATKQQWELKAEDHRRSQDHSPRSPRSPSPLNNNVYKNESAPAYESAIDREIRLAQEREKELKVEHERARKQSEEYKAQRAKAAEKARAEPTMPIHKVPQPVSSGPTHHKPRQPTTPTTPQHDLRSSKDSTSSDGSPKMSSFNDMTEADQDQMSRQESVIEREIREEQERDEIFRKEGVIKVNSSLPDKEAEQSEYERREKETLVNAHESIIDKEIRLQRERELELSRQREVVLHLQVESPVEHRSPVPPVSPQPAVVSPPPPQALSPSPQPPTPEPVEPRKKSPEPAPAPSPAPFVASSPPPPAPSPAPAPAPQEADMVSYEEAIGNYSHQGESLIARELREQREKEDELRTLWTGLGYEVPEVSREKETPFELPQPKPQPKKVEPPPPQESAASFSIQQTSTTPTRKISEDSNSSARHPAETASVASEPEFKGPRPLKDEDENDSPVPMGFFAKFVPRNETPVEREIRLSRERENEIRHEHGLPDLDTTDASQQGEPDVTETASPHRGKSTSDEPATEKKQKQKRFASSRLQLEIEREHKREEELKKSGVIHTTSDQRVSDMFRYATVVNEPRVTSATIPRTPKTPTKAPEETMPFTTETPSPEPQREEAAASPVPNGGVPAKEPVRESTPTPAPAPEPAKAEPAVVRRYTHQSMPESEHRTYVRSSSSMAETRIERELREMKEREEDLRHQREVVFGIKSPRPEDTHNGENDVTDSPRAAASPSPQPQETPQAELRQKEADQTAKSPRRKSGLAAEWERKFGGNV